MMKVKLTRLFAAVGAAAALSLAGSVTALATPATDTPSPEIVGGTTADFRQAPFAAQQFVNGSFNCSASIISATWVLTAKHCVEGNPASSMTFKLGSTNVGQGATIGVRRTVSWPN
ncbi:trypsin-like serine protease [Acaricomes phytoseiuli]|uniref:trypsin-like serine protease n=1 Tax=Acaricomes phytoseiuli TaxID=291968 RepID=UPI0003792C20|nr:trypsin-like serine protease [Acaricomes phytoseiuli]